jgi:hypothetical protein
MAEVADRFAVATGRPFHTCPASPERALAQLEQRGLSRMAAFLVGHYSAVAEGGFGQITDDVRRSPSATRHARRVPRDATSGNPRRPLAGGTRISPTTDGRLEILVVHRQVAEQLSITCVVEGWRA